MAGDTDIVGCMLVTDKVGVQLDQSAVVAHTTWFARALQNCLELDRQLVLLTPSTSRLTVGLTRVMETSGAQWVVADAGNTHYNGFTGERLQWDGVEFAPTYELGQGYLDLVEPTQPGVLFVAEVVHPARTSTQLGHLVETLCLRTTGRTPLGWGVLEPVSEPWDPAALTAQVRDDSMPRIATVHVAGRRGLDAFTAVTTVERTRAGVVEHVVAQCPFEQSSAGGWTMAERLEFGEAMHEAGVRFATAYAINRHHGLFRGPHFTPDGVPMAALLGPEVLVGRGVEATLARMGVVARPVDRGRWQSVGLAWPEHSATGAPDPVVQYHGLVDWLAAGPRA